MEKFREDLNENLYFYMAQCFNRNINKEDVKDFIDKIFIDFKKEE
jgi:GntR family transcriptional regulator